MMDLGDDEPAYREFWDISDPSELEMKSKIPNHRVQILLTYLLEEARMLDFDFMEKFVQRYLRMVTSVDAHQAELVRDAMSVTLEAPEDADDLISGHERAEGDEGRD